MGAELYDSVVRGPWGKYACRVYAPVGAHEDLLPYLVRRLLENGANTSFVNRIVDASLPAEEVVADPIAEVDALERVAHPRIPLPGNLFAPERANSAGFNFADGQAVDALLKDCRACLAAALERGADRVRPAARGREQRRCSIRPTPLNRSAAVTAADAAAVDGAIAAAVRAQEDWDAAGGERRAAVLERAATLYEEHTAALVARCVREAGKTLPDAIGEVREAVDFLRYYAARARRDFSHEATLPGPDGRAQPAAAAWQRRVRLHQPVEFPAGYLHGADRRGAGRRQYSRCQARRTDAAHGGLRHRPLAAGWRSGRGAALRSRRWCAGGRRVDADPRLAGVVFTGSTDTARLIERSLAARPGAIGTLVAETGGLNVMLADSSALAEQLVLDVVQSGFNSAGQRCSALRVLLVQEEIAPRVRDFVSRRHGRSGARRSGATRNRRGPGHRR